MQRLADVASCSLFQQVGGASHIGFSLSYMVLACCRLVVKQYAVKPSALEDVMVESAPPPTDPLNGACQLGKTQPSPFSSRKVMYENEEVTCLLLMFLQ